MTDEDGKGGQAAEAIEVGGRMYLLRFWGVSSKSRFEEAWDEQVEEATDYGEEESEGRGGEGGGHGMSSEVELRAGGPGRVKGLGEGRGGPGTGEAVMRMES